MIGIPCSGKSNLVDKMSKENTNLRVLSSDNIRSELNLPINKVFNRIVFREMQERLKSLLEKGFDVVLDATNLDEHYRENRMKIGRSCGASVIALVVNTKYQVCVERNSMRIKANKVPSNVMEAMYEQFLRTTQNLKGFDRVEYISTSSLEKHSLSEGKTRNVVQLKP